jgi:mRNA export factor
VRFVDIPSAAGAPVIASGSWDKTVRYWDVRNTSQPLGQLPCGERVYAMDDGGTRTLVVATASMTSHVVDLATNPTAVLRDERSALKHQFRSVSVTPDGKVWASGSIEGRVSINAVDPKLGKYVFPPPPPPPPDLVPDKYHFLFCTRG